MSSLFYMVGGKGIPDNESLKFTYEQLLEQLKLEEAARQNLESKAQTYIGLLSIAVTLLMALGAVNLEYIKSQDLKISNSIVAILLLYLFTEFLFVVGVCFAFKSYHTGLQHIERGEVKNEQLFSWDDVGKKEERDKFIEVIAKEGTQFEWVRDADVNVEKRGKDRIIVKLESNKLETPETHILGLILNSTKDGAVLNSRGTIWDIFIVEKKDNKFYVCKKKKPAYIRMETNWLVKSLGIDIKYAYTSLIPVMRYICENNFSLDYTKSNYILKAYSSTLVAIVFLLVLSIILVLYGIGIIWSYTLYLLLIILVLIFIYFYGEFELYW